jgi:hypothetical protein
MSDISIKRNPHFKENLEVIILKNDGSFDNVSVMNKCISGDGGSSNNLYRAMRNSINSQIFEFKKQNPNQCNSCASKDNLEVDHVSPGFIQLVDMFIKNTSITIPNTFDDNEYHSKVFKNRDQQFENDWNNFHFQNASLQFLCKKCHSKKPVTRIKEKFKFLQTAIKSQSETDIETVSEKNKDLEFKSEHNKDIIHHHLYDTENTDSPQQSKKRKIAK